MSINYFSQLDQSARHLEETAFDGLRQIRQANLDQLSKWETVVLIINTMFPNIIMQNDQWFLYFTF